MSVVSMVNYPVTTPEEPMPRRMTWRDIADDLTERITRGEYSPGEPIPSYARTAELYDVSVTTASRAISLLHERGLIETDLGRGNVVRTEDHLDGA